ncbi:MAG TPA: hypothetical protein VL588_07800 [Bdellovibrionota bacterium]|jgi:hypothetical protein|nr:hypothetical protein [Bdellovibrionota bacterium]
MKLSRIALFACTFLATTAHAEGYFAGQSSSSSSGPAKSFGLSAGVSYLNATYNRGKTLVPDYPGVELKANFRLSETATLRPFFQYSGFSEKLPDSQPSGEVKNGNLFAYGVGLTWDPFNRWPVRPYTGLAVGHYFKDGDSELGFSTSFGINVPVIAGDSFLYIEGQAHFVRFADTYSSAYLQHLHIADLQGLFYSASAGMTLML